MASTEPSLLFACPRGSSRQGGTGGLDGVKRIGFATEAAGLPVLPVYFDDLDASSSEETGHACPIRSRTLHAHPGDVSKATQPGEQGCIAARIGFERFGPKQATDLVQGGGHMSLAMSIDATGDGARCFYDGHAIPSFP